MLFDKILKLGWLKKYLMSIGKWNIFLDREDFHNLFTFGMDFTEIMLDVLQIPFWTNVLTGLKTLWQCFSCSDISLIYLTLIWYKSLLRMSLKPDWYKRGITIICDIPTKDDDTYLSLDEFQEKYKIKTNFLEYSGLILTIKLFLDNREKPQYNLVRQTICLINTSLSRYEMGLSSFYKCIHDKEDNIMINICNKWEEKADIVLLPFEAQHSFVSTHFLIDDICLKYIQFRTLHYRHTLFYQWHSFEM